MEEVREAHHPPCWFVYVLLNDGTVELRAVTTTQSIANKYRKLLNGPDTGQNNILKAWVEQAEMNHLFGSSMLAQLYDHPGSTYDPTVPKDVIQRLAKYAETRDRGGSQK